METKLIHIEDSENITDDMLLDAAGIIRGGGLVAFPTETVYGLGANALDEEAAKKIYAAKGRPSDNPLIAHIASIDELAPLVAEIPAAGRKLADAYWPGPLTMVFPKSENVPYGTTGGLETVAVRMPGHPLARKLIALSGVPIAAPSANLSGRPSPTRAEHVWQDMNGRIEMVIDGGAVGIGVESTIVDVSGEVPTLLRPGAITLEMLKDTIGGVEIDPAILGPLSEDIKPKAPGMKYRHYAPKAELVLVEDRESKMVDSQRLQGSRSMVAEVDCVVSEHNIEKTFTEKTFTAKTITEKTFTEKTITEKTITEINRLAAERLQQGYQVGILCTDETRDRYPQGTIRSVGRRDSEQDVAHNLFAVLREFDDLAVDYIFSESFSQDHLGQAIMNRLMKAAGYHIIKV